MASVTNRIKVIKQPRGGYVKISDFDLVVYDDGMALNPEENIHGSLIGMAVDYLTRLSLGERNEEVFAVALRGAAIAEEAGLKGAEKASYKLLKDIKGLDDKSIINACKLSSFDVWVRNMTAAAMARTYNDIDPDNRTIQNIRILVERSIAFFNKYGPVVKDGFTFEPEDGNVDEYMLMTITGVGTYGGYTPTVSSGDGDFLTKDTLWDFKVIRSKPKTQHTLQLAVYWIMGIHSGQECFRSIDKIGMFNPRFNSVYLLDVSKISEKTIRTIEKEVICYPD